MNAFSKAIGLIESQRLKRGCYPESLNLTKYTRDNFARVYPGEDFDDHVRQCEALKTWCALRNISVVELGPIDHPDTRHRALIAARPPYRLGLKLGSKKYGTPADQQYGGGSLGWAVIELGKIESGEL